MNACLQLYKIMRRYLTLLLALIGFYMRVLLQNAFVVEKPFVMFHSQNYTLIGRNELTQKIRSDYVIEAF